MDNPFSRGLEGFNVAPGSESKEQKQLQKLPSEFSEANAHDLPEQEKALAKQERRELMSPFELTRRLFDFAHDQSSLEHASHLRYADFNDEFADNPYAIELPQRFQPVVAEYPDKYFIVSYENRLSSYYAKGTNFRGVQLSTVTKRSLTDGKIREIHISEPAASEGFGNVQFFSVKDSVMNKGMAGLNTAEEGESDPPHGSAALTYEMNAIGEKKLIGSKFDRFDEGIFKWKGADTPVRWIRDMEIQNTGKNDAWTEYREEYIVGRHHQRTDQKDFRAKVKMRVDGTLDEPSSILISLGLDIGGPGKILLEDSANKIKVVLHGSLKPDGDDEMFDILKEDPNYAFIFEKKLDKQKIIELFRQKANALTNDWDKPSAVFGNNALNEGREVLE